IFSEEDILAVRDAIVEKTGRNPADVEHGLTDQLVPIRHQILRQRENPGVREQQTSQEGPEQEQEAAVVRYRVTLQGSESSGPQVAGIFDVVNERLLTNFVLILDEDVAII